MGKHINKIFIKDLKSIPKWRNTIDKYFDTLVEDMHMIRGYVFSNSVDNSICYPINLYRLINNAKTMFNLRTISVSDIHPIYIINRLETLFEEIGESGTMIFKILIRNYLSPKKVIMNDKLNKTAFEYILETIKMKFSSIKIQCSEMVGAYSRSVYWRTSNTDDIEYFPFCWCSI